MKRKPASVSLLVVALVTGCAAIRGGSGHFTADGDVYEVSKVDCRRAGNEIEIRLESGAAAAELAVSPEGRVRVLAMGGKGQRTMAADPGQGQGEASAKVEGNHITASGRLVRVDPQGKAEPGPGTEEVSLDVTCGRIKD